MIRFSSDNVSQEPRPAAERAYYGQMSGEAYGGAGSQAAAQGRALLGGRRAVAAEQQSGVDWHGGASRAVNGYELG